MSKPMQLAPRAQIHGVQVEPHVEPLARPKGLLKVDLSHKAVLEMLVYKASKIEVAFKA